MKEYIDKRALLDAFYQTKLYKLTGKFEKLIRYFPAAEVVSKTAFEQVVWERDTALRQLREDYGVGLGEKKRDVAEVRHGEWIPVDEKRDAFDCSECDAMASRMMNYCPNCGARMDKEDEHEAG